MTPALMQGVRVEGDTVVISVKGGNDGARQLCGELVSMIDQAVQQPERDQWVDLIARIGTLVACLYSVTPTGNDHIVRAVERLASVEGRAEDARDAAKYRAINTPELVQFLGAVEREALHQRDRWGAQGDAGKSDADWFWLIGYLAGKALAAQQTEARKLHHIITTAAVCLNWHSARIGAYVDMRPGIAAPGVAEYGA